MKTRRVCSSTWPSSGRCRGFTLIELLVVVAIIALLIGILVPSLSGARDSAKRVKTKAIMKGAGDCLELFGGENPRELMPGSSYPSSRASHDPTEDGDGFQMFGAQHLVRYLMGKDGRGYISPRSVPKIYWNEEADEYQQRGWYDAPGEGDSPLAADDDPLPRSGPYLPPGNVRTKKIYEIATDQGGAPLDETEPMHKNPVIVDPYDMPILYYAAAAKFVGRPDVAIATTIWKAEVPGDTESGYYGIYHFGDNAYFTSGCSCAGAVAKTCTCWLPEDALDFGGGESLLKWPTAWDTDEPDWDDSTAGIESEPQSFAYYILDKELYESTNEKSIAPVRSDTYIMISPGKDGRFGTRDDVKNFN